MENKFVLFSNVFKKHYYESELILIKLSRLVETIREKYEQIMLIKHQHKGNHRGITETVEDLKRNYFRPSMKQDIIIFINSCELCQANILG